MSVFIGPQISLNLPALLGLSGPVILKREGKDWLCLWMYSGERGPGPASFLYQLLAGQTLDRSQKQAKYSDLIKLGKWCCCLWDISLFWVKPAAQSVAHSKPSEKINNTGTNSEVQQCLFRTQPILSGKRQTLQRPLHIQFHGWCPFLKNN